MWAAQVGAGARMKLVVNQLSARGRCPCCSARPKPTLASAHAALHATHLPGWAPPARLCMDRHQEGCLCSAVLLPRGPPCASKPQAGTGATQRFTQCQTWEPKVQVALRQHHEQAGRPWPAE